MALCLPCSIAHKMQVCKHLAAHLAITAHVSMVAASASLNGASAVFINSCSSRCASMQSVQSPLSESLPMSAQQARRITAKRGRVVTSGLSQVVMPCHMAPAQCQSAFVERAADEVVLSEISTDRATYLLVDQGCQASLLTRTVPLTGFQNNRAACVGGPHCCTCLLDVLSRHQLAVDSHAINARRGTGDVRDKGIQGLRWSGGPVSTHAGPQHRAEATQRPFGCTEEAETPRDRAFGSLQWASTRF